MIEGAGRQTQEGLGKRGSDEGGADLGGRDQARRREREGVYRIVEVPCCHTIYRLVRS